MIAAFLILFDYRNSSIYANRTLLLFLLFLVLFLLRRTPPNVIGSLLAAAQGHLPPDCACGIIHDPHAPPFTLRDCFRDFRILSFIYIINEK
jgi:hypothetical protein